MKKKRYEELYEFLTTNPDSPICQLLNKPVPENDLEYLELWKDYYRYIYPENNYFKDLVTEWKSSDLFSNFEIRYELWARIKNAITANIDEKVATLAFKPRVDAYAESFPEWEVKEIKKLLLYALNDQNQLRYRNELGDLAKDARVDKKWLLSLTDKHRIFKDGIFEIDDTLSSKGGPIQKKDVNLGYSIRKIFSGVDLSDYDLLMIKDSPLIAFFGLADESQLKELLADHEDQLQNGDDDFDFGDDDLSSASDDTPDLESLISFLKDEGKDELLEELSNEKDTKEHPDNFSQTSEETGSESDETVTDDKAKQAAEPNAQGDETGSDISIYTNDLDYLHQEYQWVRLRLEYLDKKHNTYAIDKDDREKMRMLKQDLTQIKNLADMRLKRSIEEGFVPRFVRLVRHLKFNDIEASILKVLVINQLFGLEGNLNKYKTNASVGELLLYCFDDIREVIKGRQLFLKNSRLVKSNVIQVERSGLESSFFSADVTIDNRLTEYLVGEDYDISNYLEGSYLYKPNVTMDNVILPVEDKTELLSKITNFPTFLEAKKHIKVRSHITYGDALVMLFTGPSGTGKTMLAYAIANYLDKRILIVNLNNLSGLNMYGGSDRGIFSLLFREARMNDAILFFDESEDLLSNRLQDLLIEIEKHSGIVIFATNASFMVDEALRRRINHVQHFREPGPHLRRLIWEMHLPEKVQLHEDVDMNELALRYEINGGLIKNAVFSALAKSVGNNGSTQPVLQMDHLTQGASEQLQNKLFMSRLEKHKTPKKGFDDAVLPEETFRTLREIAEYDKAKKVLEGEWGFKDTFPDLGGVSALFHGSPGVGKTMAAEMLAFETGKNLKVVNYAQLISKYVGDTEKALENLFGEVADSNSILLFDEADAVFTSRTEISTSTDRYANAETDVLLGLIEEVNTIVVLTTNYIENIDKAFYRRLRYIVEFKTPDASLRKLLWRKLMPPKLPVAPDLNLDKLAEQFEFTGGDIKNAIIRAASMRAVNLDKTGAVTMQNFLDACRAIYALQQKNGTKIGFR